MDTQTLERMRRFEDLMARLQRIMTLDGAIKESGMTASQMFILRFLDKCEQAKASDIAKIAGLSPGAVTQVCDELEEHQCVTRIRSSEDRRVVYVAITDAGRERLNDFRKHRSDRMLTILNALGETDGEEFVRIIGRVVEIVEHMTERDMPSREQTRPAHGLS